MDVKLAAKRKRVVSKSQLNRRIRNAIQFEEAKNRQLQSLQMIHPDEQGDIAATSLPRSDLFADSSSNASNVSLSDAIVNTASSDISDVDIQNLNES